MVAPRRVIALPTDAGQRQRLLEVSRSRTEPASRVERARIILAYLEDPSAYGVVRLIDAVLDGVPAFSMPPGLAGNDPPGAI
jgi:hypothetical protein